MRVLHNVRSMACSRLLCLLLAGAAWAQNSQEAIVISQVYGGGGNTGATLRNDFIELFNRGAGPVDVSGWSVQYAAAAGGSWQLTRLSGTIPPGRYYLVQQAAGAGGTLALPAPDASGEIAMSAGSGKVALVRNDAALQGNTPASAAIADLVGYGTADFFRTAPARALSNTTAAVRRRGGCTDTGNNFTDFEIAAPEPRNSASPANDCAAQPPPAISAGIGMIQGGGPVSPLAGQIVETRGIVTARRSNGFYIQSAPEDDDGDPATSDGLLVFTGTAPPQTAVAGNFVRVTGTVTEFRPLSDPNSPTLTEITNPEVVVLSTGRTLPEPVTLTMAMTAPGLGPDLLERFEGMLVRVPVLRVVGPSVNGVFYGVVDGLPRPHREPGISVLDPAPAGAWTVLRFDGNPERIRVDSGAIAGSRRLEVASGVRVSNLTGPLDYGFRTYTILPDPAVPFEVTGAAAARPLIAAAAPEFSIASMNLRRLVQPVSDQRLDKTARGIRDILRSPDIIAVQEVESLAVLRSLGARATPEYAAFLSEGNDPGGINVGFLVNTARARVLGVTQVGKADTFRSPNGTTPLLHDRPPLVLRATVDGFPFTAVNVHLRSLINVETEEVRAKRRAQAEAVEELVRRTLEQAPGEGLIVLGDFNAFSFHDGYLDVVGLISGLAEERRRPASPLWNLTGVLARDDSYTFLQDGSAQTLDHMLVNEPLLARLSRHQVAHANADFPQSLETDAARVERFSDHDHPVAYFLPAVAPGLLRAAGVTNAAGNLTGEVSPGQIVRISGAFAQSELGTIRVLFDGIPAPLLAASSPSLTAVAPYGTGGRGTVRLRIESGGRNSNEVLLPAVEAAPQLFFQGRPGPGRQAFLNQDLTLNGFDNPAVAGTVVVLYASGAGLLNPVPADGSLAGEPLPRVALPVCVLIGGLPAEVLYAGAAPGQVAGLVQVNARIPERVRLGSAEVLLTIGDRTSEPGPVLVIR